jgi:hypothetical protein
VERSDKDQRREPDHAASDVPQEQKYSCGNQKSVAVWSDAMRRDRNKRKGRPATERPLLSRENSSNGVQRKAIRTFWRNLIGQRKAVSRNFWRINSFVFNNLTISSTCLTK